MAQTLLRDKARILRTQGKSLNEITNHLRVPKSTVRFWCRDIILSKSQQMKLYEKQRIGGVRAAVTMRNKRLRLTKEITELAVSEIGRISQRDLLVIGAALYWAEGYRKGDGEFGFTNSDPKMIRLVVRWLQEACGVDKEKIHFRVCINRIHKKRINEIRKFWGKALEVSYKQFSKPTFIKVKNTKTFLNFQNYYGTLRVKVRQSTNLRRRILGWIEGLAIEGSV